MTDKQILEEVDRAMELGRKMYESPIEKIVGEIQSQIIKQDEENIMYKVEQAVGYSVDKNELIKALEYDREQYKKGYRDGLNADKWIPVSERLPEYGREVLTCSDGGYIDMQSLESTYNYWENQHGDWNDIDTVVAWMPLPAPYKAESEG